MKRVPIYSRSQVTRFVLFLVARVGSTYLTSVLNSHSKVIALGEEVRDLEESGAGAQLNWTKEFLTPPVFGRNSARGFNVKLVHLVDPAAFAQMLHDNQCKIIHLDRQNRVKAVVSRLNGRRLYKKTGMWGLFEESNRPPPFEIDPQEFDDLLKHREKVDRELAAYVGSLELPTLSLLYEDMLKNEESFLSEIFTFLNVEPEPTAGSTKKITSDNLRDIVVNFDEIKSRYAGSVYEPMFDEVIIP